MDKKKTGDAAAALLAHRISLRAAPADTPSRALPTAAEVVGSDAMPANAQEAYALQDALIRQSGAVAGWKVGGARAPEPNCAPVFASVFWNDKHPLPFEIAPDTEFECEVAYTFTRDLPPRARPYTEDEVIAAIGGTSAAVELLAPRFAAPTTNSELLANLADGLGCGGLLVGQPGAGYREVDCASQPVKVTADGSVALERVGGNLATRLMPLVCWLANHLAARELHLRAGQIVTTGSWTGVRAWGTCRHVTADFPGIGCVELRPTLAA